MGKAILQILSFLVLLMYILQVKMVK